MLRGDERSVRFKFRALQQAIKGGLGGTFGLTITRLVTVRTPVAHISVGANIEPPEAVSGATRGFRPASKPGMPAKPVGPGKANLLITFETNSAQLTGDSMSALEKLAAAMQSDALAGFSFRVEGHADARGEADRNLKLSQLRAEAVAAVLSTRYGILSERLLPQGKGASEPLNKVRADAAENRRVTIVTTRN